MQVFYTNQNFSLQTDFILIQSEVIFSLKLYFLSEALIVKRKKKFDLQLNSES